MSADPLDGARTGKYEWDDAGELVAVTITLGSQIDAGYPNPAYYPVLNSLQGLKSKLKIGNILAAAKIAHELDHVSSEQRQTDHWVSPGILKSALFKSPSRNCLAHAFRLEARCRRQTKMRASKSQHVKS